MGIQFDGINNEIKSQTKIDFPGSIGIAGTLTYEDVTNVDSVGIITARTGVIVGSGVTLNATGVIATGVVTATSFSGSGANLTGISAGTSLSGSTNNQVTTVTGANAIQGESNLTFDGSTLTVNAFIESIGNSGRGAKLGNIAIGYSPNNNTVQTLSNGSNLHLQYSVNGNVLANEGGGDLRTADIIPHTNNSASLGTNAIRWANIHTNDLNLSNEGNANDVDGTWGNYTIQEGESDLFLINRRNGKRYKFNLTEID